MTTKTWAIVPAAGQGDRMATTLPKQYLPLAGQRVIDHTLRTLCNSETISGVIIGIRHDDPHWRAHPFTHPKLLAVSTGGETRAATVLNALTKLRTHPAVNWTQDWALVHDAVRPCLHPADITRVTTAAHANASGALLAIRLTDTLKCLHPDGTLQTLPRNNHWRAQTPQVFRCAALATALATAQQRGTTVPDEAAAMEPTAAQPTLVEGTPANLKITLPADLATAASYLSQREDDPK